MKTKGFTLIELVVVIVILGILAATALPKFVNLKGDAADASASAVAGALASATAINYAKYQISSGAATRISATSTCAALLANTALIATYPSTISATGTLGTCSTAGAVDTTNCKVWDTSNGTTSPTASITCTG